MAVAGNGCRHSFNKNDMDKRETLQRRLARLETSLEKERERLRKMCNDITWGTGMRRVKCTPSFRKEDELVRKIRKVKSRLLELG